MFECLSHRHLVLVHKPYLHECVFHTFKLATKSAVSSNVNCDIWSTIESTLGFELCVAASVLCHLRCPRVCAFCDEIRRQCDDREYGCRAASWHVRDTYLAGAETDMMEE